MSEEGQIDPGVEESVIETKPGPKKHWQIFGWGVILMMVILIVLNLLQMIDPDVNRIAMPAMVVLYVIYIFLRRR